MNKITIEDTRISSYLSNLRNEFTLVGPPARKENFFHSQGYCVHSFVEDLSPDDQYGLG